MTLRFRALSISLSAVERVLCPPSAGPSISRTLMPGLEPLFIEGPSLPAGGGVRPVSKAGGRTCGGCKPAGNGGKLDAEDVLPRGEPEARASYGYAEGGELRRGLACDEL